MTRHRIATAGLLLAVTVFSAHAARAQGAFAIGVGPSFPTGDQGSGLNTGINLLGAYSIGIPYLPVTARFDLAYNRFPYSHASGGANVWSGSANVVYSFHGAVIRPYVIGGLGLYHEPGDWTGGINGGGGVRVPLPVKVELFAEVRYHYLFASHSAQYVPLTVGVAF